MYVCTLYIVHKSNTVHCIGDGCIYENRAMFLNLTDGNSTDDSGIDSICSPTGRIVQYTFRFAVDIHVCSTHTCLKYTYRFEVHLQVSSRLIRLGTPTGSRVQYTNRCQVDL